MVPDVIVSTALENKAIMLCHFKLMQTAENKVGSIRCHSYLLKVTRRKHFNGNLLPNLTHCWLNLKCNVTVDHKVEGGVQNEGDLARLNMESDSEELNGRLVVKNDRLSTTP